MEISFANPSSIIIIIVRRLFPRVSKIHKGMILSSFVDFLSKRIHLKDANLRDRRGSGINTVESGSSAHGTRYPCLQKNVYTHFLLYRITGINLTRKNYSRQIFRVKLSKFDCAHHAPPPRTSCRIFYLKCNNYLRERAFFVNI